MFPISCQRDMADLAKTSKFNVLFDIIIVLLVAYISPIDLSNTIQSLTGGVGVVDFPPQFSNCVGSRHCDAI